MCAFPEKLKKKTAFLIKHLFYCQAQTWTNNEIVINTLVLWLTFGLAWDNSVYAQFDIHIQ